MSENIDDLLELIRQAKVARTSADRAFLKLRHCLNRVDDGLVRLKRQPAQAERAA
jgi:hypothetical protein